MKKEPKIERRSHSLLKPFLYLLLQSIIVWEVFWILTGSATLTLWSYIELFVCFIMIGYFAMKSYKIYKRTGKKTKWDDTIKAERFLNS